MVNVVSLAIIRYINLSEEQTNIVIYNFSSYLFVLTCFLISGQLIVSNVYLLKYKSLKFNYLMGLTFGLLFAFAILFTYHLKKTNALYGLKFVNEVIISDNISLNESKINKEEYSQKLIDQIEDTRREGEKTLKVLNDRVYYSSKMIYAWNIYLFLILVSAWFIPKNKKFEEWLDDSY